MNRRLDWVDDAPTVKAAVDALGYPAPVKVAQAGPAAIGNAAWKILEAAQKVPATLAQFKAAVDVVIKTLVGEENASLRASESSTSSTSELGRVEHDVAVERLPPVYTQDEYIAALSDASRDLSMRMRGDSFPVELPDSFRVILAKSTLPSDVRPAMVEDATLALATNRDHADVACRVAFGVGLDEASDEQRLDAFTTVESWKAS